MTFDFAIANGLNDRGVNGEIKVTLLDSKQMKRNGFIENGETWALFKRVGNPRYEISFDMVIPKDVPEKFRLDVFDEDFGQPYDYQDILKHNPSCIPALRVWVEVEEIMQRLSALGIVTGHVFGEYI